MAFAHSVSFKIQGKILTMRSETENHHREDKEMKDKKKITYTIIRMFLAIVGVSFVIADMMTECESHTLLAIGMCFIAIANVLSKKGYCLIRNRRFDE